MAASVANSIHSCNFLNNQDIFDDGNKKSLATSTKRLPFKKKIENYLNSKLYHIKHNMANMLIFHMEEQYSCHHEIIMACIKYEKQEYHSPHATELRRRSFQYGSDVQE